MSAQQQTADYLLEAQRRMEALLDARYKPIVNRTAGFQRFAPAIHYDRYFDGRWKRCPWYQLRLRFDPARLPE